MKIVIRLVCVVLLSFIALRLDAAAAPATSVKSKTGPVIDREAIRAELSSYFAEIARNSPTVLGGISKSPDTMAAIQARIASMSDGELAHFQKLMAATPDWKLAPEAFAGAFPPEVLQQTRRVGNELAQRTPKGEILRDDVRTLTSVLKLLPDAKLAELGITRKMVNSLDGTFSGMTPIQATMLQKRISETGRWGEKNATALASLPPALQRGAAALAEHGALTDKDKVELEQFRNEIVGLLRRINALPPEARARLKTLNTEGLEGQIAQLANAPHDIVFMVRHNMPEETLKSLRTNVVFLERVTTFSAAETKELEQFRSDLARAFKQVKGEGEQEWDGVDAMLAKLGPEHLFILQKKLGAHAGWQEALPVIYQTLASPEVAARIHALDGTRPDTAAVKSLELFRQQGVAYIDAVRGDRGIDPGVVASARTTMENASPGRLELIRSALQRLPESATAPQKLAIVAMHEIDFGCSLSMVAVPEVCFPEVCFPEVCVPFTDICTRPPCTPAGCTPAVTVTANFDSMCNPIEDAMEAVEHSIVGAANTAVDGMRASIQASIEGVQTTVNASIASVNQVVSTSVSAITSTVTDIYAFIQTIPDLAWSAIKLALNLLLDVEIRNGVTVRDLVARGPEQALTSMKTLLGLANGWWTAVSSFTLPQIPCPPTGFHTPFGDVGDGAASANYARYRLMIDGIVGMIPDTETSLKIKVPAQVTFMMYDFLGICLEQAAADADAAEGTARHSLVLGNFANMQTFVGAQVGSLATAGGQQTTNLLALLTTQNASTASTVVSENGALQLLVNDQSATTQSLINSESSEIQTLLQSENDTTQSNIASFQALDLRMKIEHVLQSGLTHELAALQLLEPAGYLGLVSTIVGETIESMTLAGEGIGQAQKYLDSGLLLMNAGSNKDALREFMKAYREVTR